MSGRHIGAVALRIVRQFRRDRRTLSLLVVVPTVVTLLVGYILREGETVLDIAVVEPSATSEADARLREALVSELRENERVSSVVAVDAAAAWGALREGELQAVVGLPDGFSAALLAGRRPQVALTLEGTNPSLSGRAVGVVTQAVGAVAVRALAESTGQPGLGLESLVGVRAAYVYGGPEFDVVDFNAPMLAGLFPYLFVFSLTAVSFLRERIGGTLERLLATPASRTEIVLGYMAGFGFFAFLQSALILALAVFALRIDHRGNLALLFLVVAVMIIGAVNLGIFLSAFARNEQQAMQFLPAVMVPQGLLSGVIFPLESLPAAVRWASDYLPLTYANTALRAIMLKGQGLGDPGVLGDLGVLVGFAVFFVVLGALSLRRAAG